MTRAIPFHLSEPRYGKNYVETGAWLRSGGRPALEEELTLGSPCYTVVLSDTDNDLDSVLYTLWITGLCNRKGRWKRHLPPIRLVHTGDWLNKWDPAPEVADFFRTLQETAPRDCEVVLLNGNHEVEILRQVDTGASSRLNTEQIDFIRRQNIMLVVDNTLYLHGYPTFQLLRLLQQVQKEQEGLNAFNRKFRKAFYEGRYALYRDAAGLELLGDIRQVRDYYVQRCIDGETRGDKIGRLLTQLHIDTVIHGHRPHMFTQIDDELASEVPGVRIIDNDNRVRRSRLGAAVVDCHGNVVFVNLREMYLAGGEKAFRKRMRRLLAQTVQPRLPS
ncbi:MAG: metallophosphoesterase [Magnetococcales bacterium]|nr:metallophosphoesterase [Magnetococcales bacterium]